MTDTQTDWGAEAARWIARLAEISEPGPGVTRLPFTDLHRAVLPVLREMMEGAGLAVHIDAAGTLIGRRAGPPGARTLLMGSHQDSVRQGGAYDGAMGVVLPVLALRALGDRDLPFAVEVMAFADEEGVRFPTALMGPRALAGTFDGAALDLADPEGVTLRQAMTAFGLDPEALPGLRRDPDTVLGWIECHIEQGPVLETEGEALGVVTAICGIERHAVTLTGQAAHAGTVPMALRRDALAGAAEIVAAVEARACETEGLLATVGALRVLPGVVNAVPGSVEMTIEIRAPEDAVREAAGTALADLARAIAERRGLGIEMRRTYAQPAAPCDHGLQDALAAAIRATGGRGLRLASGATHDTSAMADLCPVAMLFLACRDGVSHNPAEFCAPADMGRAVAALAAFLAGLSGGSGATREGGLTHAAPFRAAP
jgi:allantoate deiminase